MHACGHDAHTAIGLGLAEVLAELKDELKGKIKLVFQPAEEGVRGARAMAEAGVVDDVDYMIGVHVGVRCKKLGELICGGTGFLATTKLDVTYEVFRLTQRLNRTLAKTLFWLPLRLF